jgi:cell pole-organizing protein PopZ
MADKAQAEPTMEEILASIRRIISEDEQQGGDKPAAAAAEEAPKPEAPAPSSPPPPADDILELTEVVNADGSVSSIKDAVAPEPEPLPEPEPFPEPSFEPEPEPEAPAFARAAEAVRGGLDFDLLSEGAASSAAASFSGLLGSVSGVRGMPLGDGAKTLEELVKDLLRPMLKDWLDRNLPGLVERLVAREIAKIAGRAERH